VEMHLHLQMLKECIKRKLLELDSSCSGKHSRSHFV
jgi:hypothetical protein